jgi:hypothetical protein
VDGSGIRTKIPPAIQARAEGKGAAGGCRRQRAWRRSGRIADAPLGTYLGWNIVAAGFHKGKICNYAAGMVPFARTRAERMANNDPRPSLEERYHDHAGYVEAVKAARGKGGGGRFPAQGRRATS